MAMGPSRGANPLIHCVQSMMPSRTFDAEIHRLRRIRVPLRFRKFLGHVFYVFYSLW